MIRSNGSLLGATSPVVTTDFGAVSWLICPVSTLNKNTATTALIKEQTADICQVDKPLRDLRTECLRLANDPFDASSPLDRDTLVE